SNKGISRRRLLRWPGMRLASGANGADRTKALWRRRIAMPTPLLRSLGILVLTVPTLTLQPARAYAQQPPTYDFNPAVPGIQGPTSPLLAAPYTHFFRTISLNVPLLVPAGELQAALPPGFNALPDAQGRATVTAL